MIQSRLLQVQALEANLPWQVFATTLHVKRRERKKSSTTKLHNSPPCVFFTSQLISIKMGYVSFSSKALQSKPQRLFKLNKLDKRASVMKNMLCCCCSKQQQHSRTRSFIFCSLFASCHICGCQHLSSWWRWW